MQRQPIVRRRGTVSEEVQRDDDEYECKTIDVAMMVYSTVVKPRVLGIVNGSDSAGIRPQESEQL